MEENKVAQKLEELIGGTRIGGRVTREVVLEGVDAILQSPDLRVTLVEPRYYVDDLKPAGYGVWDREIKMLLAEFVNGGGRLQRAHDYADWLNSKEPK